ncbi:hypothetical protein [Leucobacter sp. W1478]|uniref:hypothetical protein n=1 Tax=Leucobacter sp. W1478 TaxID=3439065 RepID=UPI003F3FDCCD
MSPVPRSARINRRRFTMRAATLLLAAIVTVVGLWGVSHADDIGLSTPAAASSTVVASSVDAAVGELVDTAGDAAASESMLIGVVICLLGILCGLALAILIVFTLRCRQMRFRRQRPQIALIAASAAFNHRGRHRFGLHDLSLLRI